MDLFCDEIWWHLAGYCINLKDIARVWLSCPKLFRNERLQSAQFWKYLISSFNSTHIPRILKDINNVQCGLDILRFLFTEKVCSRSGCYRNFIEWENDSICCKYHSGKLNTTGYLSCCRGKGFSSLGCKQGSHEGRTYSLIHSRREYDLPHDHVSTPAMIGIHK